MDFKKFLEYKLESTDSLDDAKIKLENAYNELNSDPLIKRKVYDYIAILSKKQTVKNKFLFYLKSIMFFYPMYIFIYCVSVFSIPFLAQMFLAFVCLLLQMFQCISLYNKTMCLAVAGIVFCLETRVNKKIVVDK